MGVLAGWDGFLEELLPPVPHPLRRTSPPASAHAGTPSSPPPVPTPHWWSGGVRSDREPRGVDIVCILCLAGSAALERLEDMRGRPSDDSVIALPVRGILAPTAGTALKGVLFSMHFPPRVVPYSVSCACCRCAWGQAFRITLSACFPLHEGLIRACPLARGAGGRETSSSCGLFVEAASLAPCQANHGR